MSNPKGWSDNDWDDYEEYLQSLPPIQLKNELKSLELLGKAKANGKNIVVNNSYYIM